MLGFGRAPKPDPAAEMLALFAQRARGSGPDAAQWAIAFGLLVVAEAQGDGASRIVREVKFQTDMILGKF